MISTVKGSWESELQLDGGLGLREGFCFFVLFFLILESISLFMLMGIIQKRR